MPYPESAAVPGGAKGFEPGFHRCGAIIPHRSVGKFLPLSLRGRQGRLSFMLSQDPIDHRGVGRHWSRTGIGSPNLDGKADGLRAHPFLPSRASISPRLDAIYMHLHGYITELALVQSRAGSQGHVICAGVVMTARETARRDALEWRVEICHAARMRVALRRHRTGLCPVLALPGSAP